MKYFVYLNRRGKEISIAGEDLKLNDSGELFLNYLDNKISYYEKKAIKSVQAKLYLDALLLFKKWLSEFL